jgi:hypothetical protein
LESRNRFAIPADDDNPGGRWFAVADCLLLQCQPESKGDAIGGATDADSVQVNGAGAGCDDSENADADLPFRRSWFSSSREASYG